MNNIDITKEQLEKIKNAIQLKNNTITQQELIFMLKQTFPALTQQEYMFAVSQCKAFGLDPRKKEIYFVPFVGKNGNTIASITSYEVYANELEQAGYDFICEWENDKEQDKTKLMIRAKVLYKSNGNLRYQTPWISIQEYAKMDFKKEKLVGMWANFPSLMLEKCVLVRVCRFVLGKNMGYTAEELYNAKQYDNNAINQIVTETQERKVNIDLVGKANETNK